MYEGEEVDGRYRLLRRLGRGSYGEVWEATHLAIGRKAALKFLIPIGDVGADEQRHQRFLREAKIVALLRHPNIITVFDLGIHGNHPYLVMDLVEGQSLAALLRAAGGPLPIEQAVDIACQVGKALKYAHEFEFESRGSTRRGIIHRDIKPDNIMIGPDGRVIVCDFGLAMTLDGTRMTSGGALGTPSYMAPEQIKNMAGRRSDMYSLGCVMYELFTGHPPFVFDNPYAVANAHLTEEPDSPLTYRPDLPARLAGLTMSLLAKDPAGRMFAAAFLLKLAEPEPVVEKPDARELLRGVLTAMDPGNGLSWTAGQMSDAVAAVTPLISDPEVDIAAICADVVLELERELRRRAETQVQSGSAQALPRHLGLRKMGLFLGFLAFVVTFAKVPTRFLPHHIGFWEYLGILLGLLITNTVILVVGVEATKSPARVRRLWLPALTAFTVAGPLAAVETEGLWVAAGTWYWALVPEVLMFLFTAVMLVGLFAVDEQK